MTTDTKTDTRNRSNEPLDNETIEDVLNEVVGNCGINIDDLRYMEESSRGDRMYNIAIAMLEIAKTGKYAARTSMVRKYIRSKLQLPELHGESHFGDLRANGDAVGGHGLHLNVEREKINGKSERIVVFTRYNLYKCAEHLELIHKLINNRRNRILNKRYRNIF